MKAKKTALRDAIRGGLYVGAACMTLAAGQVLAQDQEAGSDEDGLELDRVMVTGSRISRTDLEGVSPVVSITREDLVNSGFNSVQDYFRTLTLAQGNNADDFNNSFANGTSTVNLRGLGGNATLVLLNGRRVSPYGQGQNITESFVDLNSIPFSAIERIEILKDGASAIYGADAVAGVINIILRKDYEGAEYSIQYNVDSEGDAPAWDFSAIFGGGDDTFSTTTIFGYTNREALFYRDRDFSETARWEGGADIRSSAGFPGTVWDPVQGSVYPAPGCGTLPGTPNDSNVGGSICRLNYNDFINAYPASERFSFQNFMDYKISDNVNLYWDFFFNYNNTKNIAAPAPFFGPYGESLSEVPEDVRNDPANASFLLGGLHLYFPATNPANPFGYDVFLRHRAISLGPRTGDINNHQIWNTAGVEGYIGDTRWEYDAGFTYSQSKILVENRNAQIAPKLQEFFIGALDPAGSGETLYYDPFAEFQDPRVAGAVSTTFENRNQSDELTFYGQVTGPLWEFDWGEIGAAFGAEYREQSLSAEADSLRNTGNLVGTGRASDTFGSRDQTSIYGEIIVPVGPLEFQFAARYEDYSDFGDTTKPKVGVKWTIMDGLLLRASYGESFRAPSLFELFNGTVSSFPSGLVDPARCADPNAGPGENGNAPDLTPIDCGDGQYQVDNGGNPNLSPEEADSYNIGLVWEATDGLAFQLDYWSYETENIITQLGNQTILNLNDPNFVIRASQPNGQVLRILNSFVNGDSQTTDGVDFFVDWTFEGLGGLWRLRNETTWTNSFELTTLSGATLESVGGRAVFDIPEWRSNFIASYSVGDHFVQGTIRYRSGIEDHFQDMATGDTDSRCDAEFARNSITGANCDTGGLATLDLNYTYNFSFDASVAVGCINCLDEDPEPSIFGNDTGGYFTSLDDPRGLVFFARWTQKF